MQALCKRSVTGSCFDFGCDNLSILSSVASQIEALPAPVLTPDNLDLLSSVASQIEALPAPVLTVDKPSSSQELQAPNEPEHPSVPPSGTQLLFAASNIGGPKADFNSIPSNPLEEPLSQDADLNR
ncbi:uncharacterized protein LOC142803212 [Rhipicephalus microplus]|uniref:uncharacterized protein LOC142803212 n=1 Tax=Rhipicephalus microplus TaxID=6941 RepID=UPI003F6AAE34